MSNHRASHLDELLLWHVCKISYLLVEADLLEKLSAILNVELIEFAVLSSSPDDSFGLLNGLSPQIALFLVNILKRHAVEIQWFLEFRITFRFNEIIFYSMGSGHTLLLVLLLIKEQDINVLVHHLSVVRATEN